MSGFWLGPKKGTKYLVPLYNWNGGEYGVREGALRRKIYAYVYIFRKAPSRTWRVREGALQKYMLTYIFFVRPLLEHGVYEKVPYEKYMLTYIFFVRPLLEHGV